MFSEISIVFFKLCCKNSNKGIAIKPAKEVALPIKIKLLTTKLLGLIKN